MCTSLPVARAGEIVVANSTSESGDQDFGRLPFLQLSQDLATPPTGNLARDTVGVVLRY